MHKHNPGIWSVVGDNNEMSLFAIYTNPFYKVLFSSSINDPTEDGRINLVVSI